MIEALRAGALVPPTGSHCLPLSWLVQRPVAFTDQVYTLYLEPPPSLGPMSRRVKGIVKAAEIAAARAGKVFPTRISMAQWSTQHVFWGKHPADH